MPLSTEKPGRARMQLVKKAQSGASATGGDASGATEGDVVAIGLGDRMVISEHAEVWTLKGVLSTGTVLSEPVGEISFVLIPGNFQPATAVVGYVAPHVPFKLGLNDDTLWPQIRAMIAQLGYDLDGFYVSLSVHGKPFYRKEFAENKKGW